MTRFSSILEYTVILILVFSCVQNKNRKSLINRDSILIGEMRSYIEKQEKSGFKGVVLISKNDSILYTTSVGGEGNSFGRTYYIGSLTKQFTASAILQLYEDKLLYLDDTLSVFFEKVPDDKKNITVHQLLTHTSGLPDNYIADGILDRQKAIKTILEEPLKYEVGKEYNYSAEGYNLLAIIIEVVTEKTFEDFIKDNIMKPFGLTSTGFWGKEEELISFAPFNKENITDNFPQNVYNQGKSITNYGYKGSTGMYATINDLYQWIKSLPRNKYLSVKNTELLFKPYSNVRGDTINGTYYGYGWFIQLADGKRTEIRHGGSEYGLHNGIIRMTNNGYTIIVLSNQWADEIEGRLKGVEWSTVLSIGIAEIIKSRG